MAKKAKTKSEVSLSTGATNLALKGEQEIPKMLEIVKAKIAELTKGTEEVSDTKGKSLEDFGVVEEIESVTDLIKARSAVRNRAKAYMNEFEFVQKLGATPVKFPFNLNGCSAEQWLASIDNRIAKLVNKKEIDKYQAIAKKLEDSLSAEQKRQNNLKAISDMLLEDGPLE